jgi:hypothetical protein
MARVMARVLISDAEGTAADWEMKPNLYVSQRVSHTEPLERVTGIEPALSAWEEFLSNRISLSCKDIGGLS